MCYGPAVRAPCRRLVCTAAGAAGLLLPFSVQAASSPSISALRAQATTLEYEKRAAVLSLYSLDSRLSAADERLARLRRREAALRAQRAQLSKALRVARVDERLSQRALAHRIRALYDHGSASALEVVFGASSLNDAMTELDNLDRLTSLDAELVVEVRAARAHEVRLRAQLTARGQRLAGAIRDAAAEARTLASVRAARAAYIRRLGAQEALDAGHIAQLEADARAAEAKAQELTHAPAAATIATPAVAPTRSTQASGGVLSVVTTGYCLTGRTATGLPVGWGVAAVDPSVIPLGTHLTIPGYGEAVAADTGGSIAGARVDLWFPSCAKAGGWGTRSVTIALH